MLRTHTCGVLGIDQVALTVTLCGWIHKIRDKGSLIWIDLRDWYGITQLVFEEGLTPPEVIIQVRRLGREYVVQVTGKVVERTAKNFALPTGHVEVAVHTLNILNPAKTPPFLIESDTDAGEELRMQYRYLDLRRPNLKHNIVLRHTVCQHVRTYLTQQNFVEVETPLLLRSTPGGARDFLVPSRLHPTQFYALPQSPQIFKQLLMVAGLDRYYQIAKCFRDEDFRADRQPEFTQIDCELSFTEQEDILQIFEEFIRHIFKTVAQIELGTFPRMTYQEAMQQYGTDKPDLRFNMAFVDLTEWAKKGTFKPFHASEVVLGICVKGSASYSRRQLDELNNFVKKNHSQVTDLICVKYLLEGGYTSSIDKFYHPGMLTDWARQCQATSGDLLLILGGPVLSTQTALHDLRCKLRDDLNLIKEKQFAPLWVVDFPLLEWNHETATYVARHHPFTAPKKEDIEALSINPAMVRAHAYDLVINGMEIGGGSMRIHERSLQEQLFKVLGISVEQAQAQFGYLLEAFDYGAPPHGGIAFGLDRLCALLAGEESIRPFIAFPKNNAGRDVMMKAPSFISSEQLEEMGWSHKVSNSFYV